MIKKLEPILISTVGFFKLTSLYSKTKYSIREAIKNFLKCGILGWCIEILFTSLNSLRHRDMSLCGHTSIWMFPIYGSAFLIKPLSKLIKNHSLLFRGSIYTFFIYLVEFITGHILMKHHICPWNYHNSRWQIHDVIRLDYAPYWFCTGLLFERLLKKN